MIPPTGRSLSGLRPFFFAYRERSVQMDKLLVTILTCAVIIAKEVLNDD